MTYTTAVKQDLVISCYKPSETFTKNFLIQDSRANTWSFINEQLEHLPIPSVKDEHTTSVASEVGNRMSEGQNFKEALINTFTNEKSLAVIGTSTVIGAATSGLSAVATGTVTTTALTIGRKTT